MVSKTRSSPHNTHHHDHLKDLHYDHLGASVRDEYCLSCKGPILRISRRSHISIPINKHKLTDQTVTTSCLSFQVLLQHNFINHIRHGCNTCSNIYDAVTDI
ncbi:hypothetical protein J6590_033080 [Homalodisca vitripennis]|nr:hypothetical protein J6590_033080 [Homalodisca vitripennis]